MRRRHQAHDDQEVVWQAEGVVMEALGCEAAAAGVVLSLRARAEERAVGEVAADVVAGKRGWLFNLRV